MIKPTVRKILSIDDAPIERPIKKKFEKLGIIQPEKRFKNFLFKAETFEELNSLKEKINNETSMKVNDTDIVSKLISKAARKPKSLIKDFK